MVHGQKNIKFRYLSFASTNV